MLDALKHSISVAKRGPGILFHRRNLTPLPLLLVFICHGGNNRVFQGVRLSMLRGVFLEGNVAEAPEAFLPLSRVHSPNAIILDSGM